VKISEYSVYPNESEILLLPGTVLKVIDQLDMGNGLVVVQMREIPSQREIEEILLKDTEAIYFWSTIASDRFEIPLEDFCQALLRNNGSPVVRKIIKGSELEAYQKYWSLWIFCGGDLKLLSAYINETHDIPNSHCMMSLHRFGLILIWFGHFSTLLDQLYNAIQLGMIYDDSTTGPSAVGLLSTDKLDSLPEQWLIRCSPKRDFPYTISYAKPKDTDPGYEITHQRIFYNLTTRQYKFVNVKTNESFMNESIYYIINTIKTEYKFGQGIKNNNLSIITNPQNINYHLYVGDD